MMAAWLPGLRCCGEAQVQLAGGVQAIHANDRAFSVQKAESRLAGRLGWLAWLAALAG